MKVSYLNLKQHSEELHSSYNNIKEILENVKNIGSSITKSGCWSGEAADYYLDKLNKLSGNFEEVFLELEKSAIYLDKVLERYESIDVNLSGAVNNINVNIGSPSSKVNRTLM